MLESYPRLDIRWLKREGLLSRPNTVSWSDGSETQIERSGIVVTLRHRPAGTEFTTTSQATLTATPCFFGGRRLWWLCPSCKRRVAILVAFPDFRCRNCHPLGYASSLRPSAPPQRVCPYASASPPSPAFLSSA